MFNKVDKAINRSKMEHIHLHPDSKNQAISFPYKFPRTFNKFKL